MRSAWLFTIGAALSVVTTTTRPATAAPSSMAWGAQPVASTSSDSWTEKLKFWNRDTAGAPVANRAPVVKPTDSISPWRHPISYLSAAMSETPAAASLKRNKTATNPVDDLSLDVPVGPPTPELHIAVSQLAERKGNLDQARAQLQEAMAKWPRDVELLRAAARMEDRQGNLQLAESLYQRAVTVDPQNAGALNDLGLCLARQGKLNQSVQALEQAINLQPDKALYRNNAATVLVEMHQDQRALAHLSSVHGQAESSFNLGQLLADRGRPHEAVAYYQRALALDPSMQQAQAAIAQLNGGAITPSQYAAEPQMQPQGIAPAYGPQLTPQQPVSEPQFPATARGPAYGTSSYIPPTNYYPSSPLPAYTPSAPVYQTATAPRYLPPVQAAAPGTMVR